MKNKKNFTKYIRTIVALILVIGVGFIVKDLAFGKNNEVVSSGKVVSLDHAYIFKARNSSGQITNQLLDMKFTGVHKETEVLIKGQRASARNGKNFLLFDVAVTNNTDYVLYLNPIDLIRLVEGEDVKLAPQVHQGNLEIRPQSTKITNIGFVIEENKRNFSIQVGELKDEKETFQITL